MESILGALHPIVLAPLAGGPSTPELAAAVSRAGGLGTLGAAYLQPDEIRKAIAGVRRLCDAPFAVNLFWPEPVDDTDAARAQALLAKYRSELGIAEAALPSPLVIPFEQQLQALIDERVPIASFTFGVPDADAMSRLRGAGIRVLGTATHVAEAVELERAGVDAIVAQGAEAGGHRGTFNGPAENALVGTLALVPQMVDAVSVPVIAAGGIMDGRGIAAALALGARAAALGTAFLCCDEAGTDDVYRKALTASTDTSTSITTAFSGKAARGIRNRFMAEVTAPAPFPVQNVLTRDIRAAARKQGRGDLVNHWAGQGSARVRSVSAGRLMELLLEELREALDQVARWRATS